MGAVIIAAPAATPAPVTLLLSVTVVAVTAVETVFAGIFVPTITIFVVMPAVEAKVKTLPAAVAAEVLTVAGSGIP